MSPYYSTFTEFGTNATTTTNRFRYFANALSNATITVDEARRAFGTMAFGDWSWTTTTSSATTSNVPVTTRVIRPQRWCVPIPVAADVAYISENHPDPDSTIEIATIEFEPYSDQYRITASGGRFEGCEQVRIVGSTVRATIRGFIEAGRTEEQAQNAAIELYVHSLFAADDYLRDHANEMLNVMTEEGERFQPPPDLEALFNAQREERRAAIVRHREETERMAEVFRRRDEERREAVLRADELLHSVLTKTQSRMLREKGHFFLVGSKGNRYQICRGLAGNVYRVDKKGRRTVKLCGHASSEMPDEDTMVAQKLMLETDEERFLAIANHTPMF